MANSPDILVVGAGITGATIAYHLALAGITTTIVERAGVAEQASRWNPGGLNPLHGPGIPGPMATFAMACFRSHLDSGNTLGGGYHLRPAPRIQLAENEDEERRLRTSQILYNATEGFSAEFLQDDELHKQLPGLNPAIRCGLMQHGNYSVETNAYAHALLAAARSMGAQYLDDEVTGIDCAGNNITAVKLAARKLPVGGVVFATGAWSSNHARWLGLENLVSPIAGQMLCVTAPDFHSDYDVTHGLSGIYRQSDGSLLLGGTEESRGLAPEPDDSGQKTILRKIARLMNLGSIQIHAHGAGARPISPDQLPVIGQAPGWNNAYLATGGGRKGVLYASGMGLAIAHEVSNGAAMKGMEQLSPGRFSDAAKITAWQPADDY